MQTEARLSRLAGLGKFGASAGAGEPFPPSLFTQSETHALRNNRCMCIHVPLMTRGTRIELCGAANVNIMFVHFKLKVRFTDVTDSTGMVG